MPKGLPYSLENFKVEGMTEEGLVAIIEALLARIEALEEEPYLPVPEL